MSKYTTELRFICEQQAGLYESEGYNSISDIIEKARPSIFNFDYPIFDEEYRNVLETKILRHYYLREICAETVGVWKHFLETKMNEIMPYYNKLYGSELIKFNPMYDVDLTTDHNKQLNGTRSETGTIKETEKVDAEREIKENGGTNTYGTNTVNNNEKNDHWDIYSDTPQGGLNGVRTEEYLTNARHITDDKTGSTATTTINNEEEINKTTNGNEDINRTRNNNNTKNGTLKDIEDYIQHVQGKTGGTSYSKLLEEFRNTFLNIDVKIINDLSDLFFNLW